MTPIQQMLLGAGGAAKKTYMEDVFSTYVYTGNLTQDIASSHTQHMLRCAAVRQAPGNRLTAILTTKPPATTTPNTNQYHRQEASEGTPLHARALFEAKRT